MDDLSENGGYCRFVTRQITPTPCNLLYIMKGSRCEKVTSVINIERILHPRKGRNRSDASSARGLEKIYGGKRTDPERLTKRTENDRLVKERDDFVEQLRKRREDEDSAGIRAAALIQKSYRGYSARPRSAYVEDIRLKREAERRRRLTPEALSRFVEKILSVDNERTGHKRTNIFGRKNTSSSTHTNIVT